MARLFETLNRDLQEGLERIRNAVHHIGGSDKSLALNWGSSVDQSQRVLNQLEEWLLDEEQRQALCLNPWDVFFLYASVFLCHIGSNGVDKNPAFPNFRSNNSKFIHSQYSYSSDSVLSNWMNLGINDSAQAAVISKICLALEVDPTTDQPSSAVNAPFDGVEINISLLAAAIRLANALDLKAAPTMLQISAYLPSEEPLSTDCVDEAFDIIVAGPHPYSTGTIRLRIKCRNPEIHRALKHHESVVQRLINEINQQASPRFLFSDVIFEIEPDGYKPIDLKFSVDSTAALQLFTGNRLYTDNRVFLRELIQNAVDACNLRKLREDDYNPAISISFNDDISIITVRDNGIGMDQQWITKYFLKIGISLYQSGEVRSTGKVSTVGLSFISQFGIGFLSSFLVAEKIVIKTRKAGLDGLMITVSSPRDYFDVRLLKDDYPIGTEVILYLRKSKINYSRSLEYSGYLKTNIRFVSVPVRLHDEQGQTSIIGNEKLSFENPETADIDFIAPLHFSDSEGYVFLRAQSHVDHIYALGGTKGGVSVFQDGIFVTQLDSLLPEGARQYVLGRINLLGAEKCALSMDRNRIFWTEKQLRKIKKSILHGLVAVANKFMEAVEAQAMDENTRSSIINHLAIFFEFNDVDDEMHHTLCQPLRQVVEKRFRDFVRIQFPHTRRAAGISEADGYSEAWQQGILASFVHKKVG